MEETDFGSSMDLCIHERINLILRIRWTQTYSSYFCK